MNTPTSKPLFSSVPVGTSLGSSHAQLKTTHLFFFHLVLTGEMAGKSFFSSENWIFNCGFNFFCKNPRQWNKLFQICNLYLKKKKKGKPISLLGLKCNWTTLLVFSKVTCTVSLTKQRWIPWDKWSENLTFSKIHLKVNLFFINHDEVPLFGNRVKT